MRKLKVLLLSCFVIFSCMSLQAATLATASINDKETQYLFIQTAKAGVIQVKKKPADEYLVVLHDVDNYVTYFSNVPKRITGFMPMQKFLDVMQQSAASYPKGLNAGLIGLSGQKDEMVRYVFTLKNPKYDPTTGSIVFDAAVVPGDQTHPLPNEASFRHVALFIDSVCIKCGGDGF